ncbi:MAG: hypothetical protein GWN71_28960, partial [Gammaproteobacteria bacterium]|nr:hypothetical protein [Gemmatimonadota bacterium]NIU77437.1 hypothetical protein [Gammaproteobacteria bacterium]
GRHPHAGAVLAVAVLLVLTLDPGAVRAVGAWLSVAAVWGGSTASRWVPTRYRRVSLIRLAATSAGAAL